MTVEAAASPRIPVVGTVVDAGTFAQAVAFVEQFVAAGRTGYVCPANVYSVMLARRNPEFRSAVSGAARVIADGMPIVWALRSLGAVAERVHGDDLFLALAERNPAWRQFLLGGAPGQAQAVAHELERRIPDIRIVGLRPTPVRPMPAFEAETAAQEIAASQAQVVWVGMGTPAQDLFMAAHAHRTGAVLLGVGSAFDLLAGRTRQAPDWVKNCGLQWLFRLGQEPRRLLARYLVNNPLFLVLWAAQLLRRQRRAS